MMEAYAKIENLKTSATSTTNITTIKQGCYAAMNDDFNTSVAIAHLFDAVRYINSVNDGKETITEADKTELLALFTHFINDILGVNVTLQNNEKLITTMDNVVQLLITMRNEAKANKDWPTSDALRDKLIAAGIQIKDTKEGTTYSMA